MWDFLRIRGSKGNTSFTAFPHLTLAIERDRLLVIITVPNGIRPALRQRLVELEADGFSELLQAIDQRLVRALRGDRGAAPIAILVQRRYLTQRSSAIIDAILEFDMRTAFQFSKRQGKGVVKVQPQWLNATYSALARKRSNLQFAVGASFPYTRSSSVGERAIIDRIVETWIACKPLLTTMGLK